MHIRTNLGFFHLFAGFTGFCPHAPCTSFPTPGPSRVLAEGLQVLHSLFSFLLPRAKLCESSGRWGRPSRSATSSACSTHSRTQTARKTGRVSRTAAAQGTQVGTAAAVDVDGQAGGQAARGAGPLHQSPGTRFT